MPVTADLIVTNAHILTMDDANPRAEAIALAGGRILAVGSTGDVLALKGEETQIIDAGGTSVLPGFIESHIHMFGGAEELPHLQVAEIEGFEALKASLSAHAAAHPDDALLKAHGAGYTIISETETLTRHHIDRIVADRPVVIVAADHHTCWANTRALELAGILHGKVVNPGNEVVMGPDGLATGELREGEAMSPVLHLAGPNRTHLGIETGGEPDPAPTAAEWEADKAIMRAGLAHAARHGITSFHNMDGNLYQLQLLSALEEDGTITVRGQVPFHFKKPMTFADLEKASEMDRRYRGEWISSGMVKVFMDGVMESGTAFLVEPYADRPDWHGEPYFSNEEFAELATEIDRRGLQIAVHAIGDGAVRRVLNGYEAAQKANGVRDSRHRVEHVELITEEDMPRFAELGVVASMQPPHPPGGMCFPLEPTLSRIGEKRRYLAYAWRRIKETGAALAFSSDWPVSPIDPIAGIHAAVTRKLWQEGDPDHSVSLHDAIAAYTIGSAYAGFAEDRKGMLKPGYFADLVILDNDIEAIDPERIHEIRPKTTICGGRVTYEA
ncbi:amidohydrolase [Shinella sp. CPCC 101442]|uniref:amidohydrolase n=1 Tax=Shinella sp. CPCC 101442 TaxID=2932265 RepID=UPI0021530B13|nr:amidohydrolase [Shinella sp. CPCC 101442]MCR6497694.1 amidohydrolase [Shinella sp. CPCC 101442]